tara:strand:- start:375 stop:527 length:153 start_codon:yes stop_codon:yes gene_type:complete
MATHNTIPDFAGIFTGQVPIRVEVNLSMQSMVVLAVVIILSNVISRAIIK